METSKASLAFSWWSGAVQDGFSQTQILSREWGVGMEGATLWGGVGCGQWYLTNCLYYVATFQPRVGRTFWIFMFDFWYLYPLHHYTRESLHKPSFLNLLFAVTLNLSFRQTSLRPICGLGSFNPVCPCHKSLGKACKVWIQKFPRGKEILQYTPPQTFRCDAFSLGHKFSIWLFATTLNIFCVWYF